MKKHINIAIVAMCAALSAEAATPEARDVARAEILKGVQSIDVGGGALPGPLILMGDDAFPLAECRNYDGSCAFAAAGAFHGQGRAVYLSHPAYLDSRPFQRDTAAFLKQSVQWVAAGKAKAKVAVLRSGSVVNAFKELGVADVARIESANGLKGFDVLVGSGFQKDEVPVILDFVKRGGGLIGAGLGWGFLYYNPDACFAEEFVDNRLMAPMGVLMGDVGTSRIDGAFPTSCDKIPSGTYADDALALAIKGEFASSAERKQVTKTLTHLVNSLPGDVRPDVNAKLMELASRPEASAVPSPDKPVGSESVFARLAIIARRNAWQAEPEKIWPADPAAAVYPGLVKPGTPSIKRTVSVDLAIPRWHSTGVFAPAGQALTVTLGKEALKLGLRVRVGSTADDLSGCDEWRRAPLVTVEFPLVKETTTFATPFGGLVYIVVPDGAAKRIVDIGLDGGVMAPWFKLGRDTNEKFIRECAESGSPWGEIESRDFVVTSETRGLQRVDDPQWIAEYWDKVMAAMLDFAQWKSRTSPERFCSDVQLTAGWLHNGYPLMSHINDEHFDWAINKEQLIIGDAWGVFHEIGHNHQNRDWTPDGTGEVTVNLFTCYAIETVAGANIRDNRFPTSKQSANRRVKGWVAKGKSFEDWKRDYFVALELYTRIKEAYGWNAYKETFARYLEPGFTRPKNDAEKWQIFARELSKTVNADMASVLSAWSIPLSDETKQFCARFPAAKPSITQDLVMLHYEAPKTEPVAGLYLGVTLAGKEAGRIETFASRGAIPGGEQDKRWKTTHLLLRRIEPTNGSFTLGNRQATPTAWEAPREVEITRPYYIGVYEVTQEQYYHVTESWRQNNFGAAGDRETRPVNAISYDEIRGSIGAGINWPKSGRQVANESFMGRLREIVGFRAEFDLPTEAQWEYAARALTTNEWNNGEPSDRYRDSDNTERDRNLDKLGRYFGNGGESRVKDDPLMKPGVKTPYGTAAVGSYQPNAWGLYDTHGNVYEWVLDYWMPTGETTAYAGKDPVGPADNGLKADGKPKDVRRVMRGGSWWNYSFGSPGRCVSWDRNLGNLCDPGNGHGAAGFRICVPAAAPKKPQVGQGYEKLTPDAYQSRKAILADVEALDSPGLPGPVYCLSEKAFPLIAARNWDSTPAACAGAAFHGSGRVVVVADDAVAPLGDNKKLLANAKAWLSNGGKAKVKTLDLATITESEIPEWEPFVEKGGGLLAYGRAWPWRQKVAEQTGQVRVADWPGNKLLAQFGLLVGDFCVGRTSAKGFSARRLCEEGASVAPAEVFQTQSFPKSPNPVIIPQKTRNEKGILVRDGETIAFLGDSITRLGAQPLGYISLVVKGLEVAGVKNVGVVPAGIDGQHAGDMRGRIGGILANPDVKIITISCGVNDVWGFDWGRGLQLEEYQRDVRAMYNKAAVSGVQVVALTPTLIQEDPSFEKNRILDPFADFIRAEAKLRGLPLADCRAAEVAALAKLPKTGEKRFTYDGVHPVWEGNKLIAHSVLEALGVPAKHRAEIEKAWDEMARAAQQK